MHRRTFLAAVAGGALASLALPARRAFAASPASRVRTATRDARGVTLHLELDHAPFPAPGCWYKDSTVVVFVPEYFRFASREQVSALVHFHGHSTTADKALASHELREQMFDSKQNAILVVPQGPVNATDSSCGKIEAPLGLARMMGDLLATLATTEARDVLGACAIPSGARPGTVCLSAHSGGYHAAASCLKQGGLEINEVYLFDALYAESEVFREWVIAGKGRPAHARHKLVTYYTQGTTEATSKQLFVELEKSGVRCGYEAVEGALSREDFTRAEALCIRTGLTHGGVTHELNGLRDCLYGSGLTRHLRTSWFDKKSESRRLDRRR